MLDKDIKYYQKELKDNIASLKDNPNNQPLLDNVAFCFRHLFDQIRLFLINVKEYYYGYFLMHINLKIDFKTSTVAKIDIESGEFIIIINPLLLDSYSLKEIIYIICHIIEHIVLYHQSEIIRLNPNNDYMVHLKLNLAMDTAVNDILNHEITKRHLDIMKAPHDAINSKKLGKRLHKELKELESYLYYYKALSDDIPNDELLQESKFNDLMLRGSDSKEIVKEFIKTVASSIPESIRGLFPNYQQEIINKAISPPVLAWNNILRKFIGITPVSSKKTKLRLNRREPERFDLSGRINNHTIKIIIAIDTSKSVTSDMLKYFFNEVFSILKYAKYKLTVIECDAKVNNVYQAKKISDINFHITSRGGTKFTSVIEYVNNHNYRDALLIFFTDGFGEEDIPKPRTYRNLWIIINDKKNLSINNPYGEVITLSIKN